MDRFLIYYTRYHVMDMMKAKSLENKIEHVRHIASDKEWEIIRNEYKAAYLPWSNRIFYWLLLHKHVHGILLYVNIINKIKQAKGKR